MLPLVQQNVVVDVMAHMLRMKTSGWTDDLLDTYENGELGQAATCYALGSTSVAIPLGPNTTINHNLFPWPVETFEAQESPRAKIIEAISFLIEEAARLDRLAEAARVEEVRIAREAAEKLDEARREAEANLTPPPIFYDTNDPLPAVLRTGVVNIPISDKKPADMVGASVSIQRNGNMKVTQPPKGSIRSQIIDITDHLRRRSRSATRKMGRSLNGLFSIA